MVLSFSKICCIILLLPIIAFGQIPGMPQPQMQWGLPPTTVQQYAPGQMTGQILIYDEPFMGYPSVSQYYFDQQSLTYVMFAPHYRYKQASQWKPEYQHIQNELTTLYGEPVNQQPLQWQNPTTAATLMLLPQGWMTRFDRRDAE